METSPSAADANNSADRFTREDLSVYYEWLFPFQGMHKWLSYGNDPMLKDHDSSVFACREFGFALGDTVVRYRSYKDCDEFQKTISKDVPDKIDIGAIFNSPPKQHNAANKFFPVQKELVFDIDMDDYNDVRSCPCREQKGAVCTHCWKLMGAAIETLDATLREDFGFEHLLWVYSGRRGVHCWVCDRRARQLSNDGRAAVASFCSLYQGNDKSARKVNTGYPVHPSKSRAFDICTRWFREIFVKDTCMGLFSSESTRNSMLDSLAPGDNNSVTAELREGLRDTWKKEAHKNGPEYLWDQLRYSVKHTLSGAKKNKVKPDDMTSLHDFVFTYVYPRLDIEVSRHLNHLLKSPFCAHPATGRICVPIDPQLCHQFNPLEVPTVMSLHQEINSSTENAAKQNMWKHTSLRPYIEYFEKSFLRPLLRAESSIKLAEVRQRNALEGDW